MHRKIGRFQIPNDIIHNDPKLAQRIMARCIVVRAEQLWERDAIEYVALSNSFEDVPANCVTPDYHIEIRTLKNGFSKFRFKPGSNLLANQKISEYN